MAETTKYSSLKDYDSSEHKYSRRRNSEIKYKTIKENFIFNFLSNPRELKLLSILSIFAILLRLFSISQPDSIVFDEVHFLGFGQKYIKRQHHFDVHPPLSKLLISYLLYQFGITEKGLNIDVDGIGIAFVNSGIPYIAVRTFLGLLGCFVIPLTYFNLRILNISKQASTLGAMILALDNALVTQNRYIFLDPILLFFISFTNFSFTLFNSYNAIRPFQLEWWGSLTATGLSLGCVVSSKLNGVFTVALIGLFTLSQLWTTLCNPKNSITLFMKHFMVRAVFLGILPCLVYIATFYIQFQVLDKRLDYSSIMSPEFEMTLQNNGLIETYQDVAYGSQIRIHHVDTEGGYLHSHSHPYPGEAKQQQITLYPFKDENNIWMVKKLPPLPKEEEEIKAKLDKEFHENNEENKGKDKEDKKEIKADNKDSENKEDIADKLDQKIKEELIKEGTIKDDNDTTQFKYDLDSLKSQPLEYIKHGDVIRLFHTSTEKHLHAHNERPVFSDKDYINEVTGYGFTNFEGDSNDYFRVEIIGYDTRVPESKDQLMSIYSRFRLVHINTGCALYSRPKKLPEWAFGQQEVICIRDGQFPRSLWRIDTSLHPQFNESTPKVMYDRATFWDKLIEINVKMFKANNDLLDHHKFQSKPWEWPLLNKGISYWKSSNGSVYLIGNPIIWYSSFAAVLMFIALVSIVPITDQRDISLYLPRTRNDLMHKAGYFFAGWALNYIPYFLMKRQLFLHHYLPALTYSILLLVSLLDILILKRLNNLTSWLVVSSFSIIAFYAFYSLAPLISGSEWSSNDDCVNSRWKSSWHDYCN